MYVSPGAIWVCRKSIVVPPKDVRMTAPLNNSSSTTWRAAPQTFSARRKPSTDSACCCSLQNSCRIVPDASSSISDDVAWHDDAPNAPAYSCRILKKIRHLLWSERSGHTIACEFSGNHESPPIKKYTPISKKMIPPMKWRRIIEYIPNIIRNECQDTIISKTSDVTHPILRANSRIPERIKKRSYQYFTGKACSSGKFLFLFHCLYY